jgi:hypothetical protein
VRGSGFTPATEVRWNGEPRGTTLVDGNVLRARVEALDVAAPGTVAISVAHHDAGTPPSNSVSFTISSPPPPASFARVVGPLRFGTPQPAPSLPHR